MKGSVVESTDLQRTLQGTVGLTVLRLLESSILVFEEKAPKIRVQVDAVLRNGFCRKSAQNSCSGCYLGVGVLRSEKRPKFEDGKCTLDVVQARYAAQVKDVAA